MGSSSSKPKLDFEMTLTVDNLEVVAGQPLTGLVRINMRTSGPVSKLTLEIEGKEYGVYKE